MYVLDLANCVELWNYVVSWALEPFDPVMCNDIMLGHVHSFSRCCQLVPRPGNVVVFHTTSSERGLSGRWVGFVCVERGQATPPPLRRNPHKLLHSVSCAVVGTCQRKPRISSWVGLSGQIHCLGCPLGEPGHHIGCWKVCLDRALKGSEWVWMGLGRLDVFGCIIGLRWFDDVWRTETLN